MRRNKVHIKSTNFFDLASQGKHVQYVNGMGNVIDINKPKDIAGDNDNKTVLNVIAKIPQQGQVQYDLTRQLSELRVAANKLGLYDAADYLSNIINKK